MAAQDVGGAAGPETAGEERARWAGSARKAVGCFFLFTAGVHLGMIAADSEVYRHFADGSPLPFVQDAWSDVFMAHAVIWGLAVMSAELGMGLLLLRGGRAAKLGWISVIGFHVGLMLFGWGFWLWSIPALVFLLSAARRDWPALSTQSPSLRPVPAA